MQPLTIRKEIDIDAPIDRVWWFVGTQEGNLARHRAESVPNRWEYQDELLEERVGGRYELRGVFEGKPFHIVGQVVAYDPPRLLALTWREQDWPADTLVTFRLTEEAGRTRLTVIHSGFENLPPEYRHRAFEEYEAGRQRGFEALQALLSRSSSQVR
ncbi:MAG: SRPBCC domain-containing protein [Armatimonadetes bacterium]|nr:SRPBCC domain-containing protein [Armatimonadota bacterium]